MKKRRELDALVGNGKSRRKSKSGHELLRNDSESSELDEFISSPDTKTVLRNRSGNSFCMTCLTVLAFLLLLACIIACAGLMWVHLELKTELDNLKMRIETVESENLGVPNQLQKIHTQVQEYNKTIVSFKTGKNGLEEVIKNLTRITQQVESLQSELNEAKKDIGNRVVKTEPTDQTLVKELADVGNHVKTLENKHGQLETDINKKLETVTTKLDQLEAKLQSKSSTTSPAEDMKAMIQAPDALATLSTMASKLDSVKGDLQEVNVTMFGKFADITDELKDHQNRFLALENRTSSLEKPSTKMVSPTPISVTGIEDTLRTQLTIYVQQLVQEEQNKTDSSSVPESKLTNAILDSIRDQVKNISEVVESLKVKTEQDAMNAPNDTVPSNKALQSLQNNLTVTKDQVKDLTDTVAHMNVTMDHLTRLFIQEKNMVNNLTAQVSGVRNYLGGLEIKLEPVLTAYAGNGTENSTPTHNSEAPEKAEQRRAADVEELEDIFGD